MQVALKRSPQQHNAAASQSTSKQHSRNQSMMVVGSALPKLDLSHGIFFQQLN
jgi:hypothetical protein